MISRSTLPLVLRINALASAVCGVGMAALAGPLGELVGLPPLVLRIAGLGLLPFSVFVLYAAREPRRGLVRAVSAMDFAWVAGSLALVGFGELTGIGIALVLAIAVAVELFGTLQLLALRDGRRILAEP